MKTILLSLFLLLSFPVHSAKFVKTPYIDINPGHICTPQDKDFDRYRYNENMPYCKRNVSTRTKNELCKTYGVKTQEERRKDYTVDHIIPLSLGGSNNIKNLWCQYRGIYTGYIEFDYYRKVSGGDMRQAEAVAALLIHKHNPKGKDHVPQPKGGAQNPDRTQRDWERRH